MKKRILIFIAIILLISCLLIILKKNKFYLNDKYYNNGDFIDIKLFELNDVISNKENFILFTYNSYCTLKIPCENIFKEVAHKNKIDFYSITYEEFKNSDFHKVVKYAPSVLIIKEGKIITYLDSNLDSDLEKYQDVNKFEEWLNEYIYLEK